MPSPITQDGREHDRSEYHGTQPSGNENAILYGPRGAASVRAFPRHDRAVIDRAASASMMNLYHVIQDTELDVQRIARDLNARVTASAKFGQEASDI